MNNGDRQIAVDAERGEMLAEKFLIADQEYCRAFDLRNAENRQRR